MFVRSKCIDSLSIDFFCYNCFSLASLNAIPGEDDNIGIESQHRLASITDYKTRLFGNKWLESGISRNVSLFCILMMVGSDDGCTKAKLGIG